VYLIPWWVASGTNPPTHQCTKQTGGGKIPQAPDRRVEPSVASLFNSVELFQELPPLLIGERSNATGSKAFRELILGRGL